MFNHYKLLLVISPYLLDIRFLRVLILGHIITISSNQQAKKLTNTFLSKTVVPVPYTTKPSKPFLCGRRQSVKTNLMLAWSICPFGVECGWSPFRVCTRIMAVECWPLRPAFINKISIRRFTRAVIMLQEWKRVWACYEGSYFVKLEENG